MTAALMASRLAASSSLTTSSSSVPRFPPRRPRAPPPSLSRALPAHVATTTAATATATANTPDAVISELAANSGWLTANTAHNLQAFLSPVVGVFSILFIFRIVMTWYPEINGREFPWSLCYKPTEPVLRPTRNLVPPLAGVDISPIVWVALLSFFNETMLGPQGILSIIQREGGI